MDLEKAKQILSTTQATCVLCKADRIITSQRRGVAPLMELWQSHTRLTGFCAADKVVGKATALMYCLLEVKAVYGAVMSRPALAVLEGRGIEASFGQLVDAIQNRAGDGLCPMEAATARITEPREAPRAIRQALDRLGASERS